MIIATGSYIGEGFDDARLGTLFLAMPISWKGTLQQYVRRRLWLQADRQGQVAKHEGPVIEPSSFRPRYITVHGVE